MKGTQWTLALTVGTALVMGALAWASVPFYDWFCRVTGFGGVPNTAAAAPDAPLDRTIKVRFDASLKRDMPWKFRPMQREMELPIGESAIVWYEAFNPQEYPVAGSASYNVTPYEAGYYFNKIECFCFQEQVLQPGERVEMPVSFFVDPEIVTDRDARHTQVITLGYTFHRIEMPERPGSASASATAATPIDVSFKQPTRPGTSLPATVEQ